MDVVRLWTTADAGADCHTTAVAHRPAANGHPNRHADSRADRNTHADRHRNGHADSDCQNHVSSGNSHIDLFDIGGWHGAGARHTACAGRNSDVRLPRPRLPDDSGHPSRSGRAKRSGACRNVHSARSGGTDRFAVMQKRHRVFSETLGVFSFRKHYVLQC